MGAAPSPAPDIAYAQVLTSCTPWSSAFCVLNDGRKQEVRHVAHRGLWRASAASLLEERTNRWFEPYPVPNVGKREDKVHARAGLKASRTVGRDRRGNTASGIRSFPFAWLQQDWIMLETLVCIIALSLKGKNKRRRGGWREKNEHGRQTMFMVPVRA